jgi:metallothionein
MRAPSIGSLEPSQNDCRQEKRMSDPKKCAHPNCSCMTKEQYCSTQCEAMEKTPDINCTCEHPGCKGKIE